MFMRKSRRTKNGNAIAEFGPAMYIFFVIIALPLLDLASFMWGVGTVMMVAQLGCRKAAPCMTYSLASTMVTQTEAALANFMAYAKVVPQNGAASGVTLNVLGITTATGAPVAGSPFTPTVATQAQQAAVQQAYIAALNGPPAQTVAQANVASAVVAVQQGLIPVDRTTLDGTLYEFQVVATYNVQPLFNFNGLPFFSSVPALGAPVPITFTSTCNVEHPEGLNN
jgi:hypothetical protein